MEDRVPTALYIVPTPVGNLEDITLRALRILKEVDVILAEDTRNTGQLLKHYEIQRPMQSHHSFNENHTANALVEKLKSGVVMALVSDAGTPVISDPGFSLVRACVEAGVRVECLPGATAFVPALVNSGLPADKFTFEGFLPHKKGRQTRIQALAEEERTIIFYESPHRLLKTLTQLAEVFGPERKACVSREISKRFEENKVDSLEALHSYFEEKGVKGEIVLTVEGNRKKEKKEKKKYNND